MLPLTFPLSVSWCYLFEMVKAERQVDGILHFQLYISKTFCQNKKVLLLQIKSPSQYQLCLLVVIFSDMSFVDYIFAWHFLLFCVYSLNLFPMFTRSCVYLARGGLDFIAGVYSWLSCVKRLWAYPFSLIILLPYTPTFALLSMWHIFNLKCICMFKVK